MQPLIVIGDRTSHGGVVIGGSQVSDIDGKAIARVGDRVTCPKKGHGGTTVIATGDPTLIVDGAPAARHGDKTACGAVLLSSQAATLDDAGGGGGAASGQSSRLVTTSAFARLDSKRFDIHFLVRDEVSGSPVCDLPYRLTLETGEELKGMTDAGGLTQTIGSDSALTAKLEVPYYGDSSGDAHTGDEHGTCRH